MIPDRVIIYDDQRADGKRTQSLPAVMTRTRRRRAPSLRRLTALIDRVLRAQAS